MVATTIAYAKKHGLEYHIPDYSDDPNPQRQKVFTHLTNNNYDNSLPKIKIQEEHYHYKEIEFQEDWRDKNIEMNGYFQSWRYFHEYREDVLKAVGFDGIETKKGFCSLHYRSGDYKLYPTFHPIITEQYITEAVSRMKLNGYNIFLVFSDGMDEIKEIIKNCPFDRRLSFVYADGKSQGNIEKLDLMEMASCESNIIANSSFSWFASYINPNPEKIIVAPRRWFGEKLSHNTSDLYLPNTILF